MKMRQIQFDGVGELRQVEREIPPLKDTQVLVKVEACGLCTWERYIYAGTESMPFPFVGGHEIAARVVETGGSGHGALAGFLRGLGVDTLICGGIGAGARTALAEAGIQLFPGVTGLADAAVEALLAGRLDYQPDIQCDHHHEGEHTCGEHGCGSR